jgi:hypothetical protein
LLTQRSPKETARVLLAYLPFVPDERVRDEIGTTLAAVAARGGQPEPLLVAALKCPQPLCRGVAGEALVRGGAAKARPAVRQLLKDADPWVRLRVGLALLEGKERDRAAVPALIGVLGDVSAEERWSVEEVLGRLAGEQGPSSPGLDAASGDARKVWADWWDKHGATIDLSRLDSSRALLGYTLITQLDVRTANGKVFELGPNGKPRWELDGLRYPVDAHVLGKDRVLIAEYLNRSVTERDFKNNVLWEKKVDMPIACQRLPNGHTFIATRRQLLIVDRQGQETFAYHHPTPGITAAQRLRSGEMALVTTAGLFMRLDAGGKVLKSFPVGQLYALGGNLEVLPGNRVLVPLYRENRVAEFNAEGGVVWQAKVNMPTSAVRLPSGNTLVVTMFNQTVLELNRAGETVWRHDCDGRPWRARKR